MAMAMANAPEAIEQSLRGLNKADWLARLSALTQEQASGHGSFERLGARHSAAFIKKMPVLLVSFESIQGIQALSESALPVGWQLSEAMGWSSLCLMSDGDTWFRDGHVYGYFDRLIDEGFFESFDRIVFFGAGPCGYAAAAFSVAAPGASVVVIQPQATLDPRVSEWDDRFTEMRRTSFTDRYGYAPDMLDAAARAFVIYDPREHLDAVHAALFTRPNVVKLRTPFIGGAIQSSFVMMGILQRLLAHAGYGTLDPVVFAKLYRARRRHNAYLRRLMAHLDKVERVELTRMLCANVVRRINSAPRFRKRLQAIERAQARNP